MPHSLPATPCVRTGTDRPRRLRGTEVVVIIVITLVGAALVVRGVPVRRVCELLCGTGVAAAAAVALVVGKPSNALRPLLAAMLSPAARV